MFLLKNILTFFEKYKMGPAAQIVTHIYIHKLLSNLSKATPKINAILWSPN